MTVPVARIAYQRWATAKAVEIEAKIRVLSVKLGPPTTGSHTHGHRHLRKSMHQTLCCMQTVRAKLLELHAADGANWDEARNDFDDAWEDVTQSIRNVVVRML